MASSSLTKLPAPVPDKQGWPWTDAPDALPPLMPDGQPWPKISVVTPSFNQGEYLEETLRSVLLQGYPNLEYIVIDGGSSDASAAIIERYRPWLAYAVSEPDKGQADAIAKGLSHATGDLFNWINSDDYLMPGALAQIAQSFVMTQADVVAAVCEDFGQGANKLIANAGLTLEGLMVWQAGTVYHQPACWLRRQALVDCGGIDTSLHYVFDWEMTLRYLRRYPRVHYLAATVARFRLHSESKTVSQQDAFEAERQRCWNEWKRTLPQRELRRLIDEMQRHKTWLSMLQRYENDQQSARFLKACKIAAQACLDPRMRFTRMTAGAVRRHVLNQYV